jgi:ceramide glucosyltransferase
MTAPAIASALFCGILLFLHLISIAVVARRWRPRPLAQQPSVLPAVSIVRPVCGLEHFLEETLRSSFELAYPRFELIFCVASARDPAIAVIERLIASRRDIAARLIEGDERVSRNPKLNNCVKGWRAARYD